MRFNGETGEMTFGVRILLTGLVLAAATSFAGPLAAPFAVSAARAAGPHDVLAAGPKVGTKIPHDLSTVDPDGQHRDFKSLARARGLIVLFTRSVDW